MLDDTAKSGNFVVQSEVSEAFEVLAGSLEQGLILICDHASNALPDKYGTLGLEETHFKRHIAYDIGSAGIIRRLSDSLGVPAVMTRYSRLLIDCNRGEDDPTLIMRLSDGTVVDGNRNVDRAEREKRIGHYYTPYHRTITALIDRCISGGVAPVIFSLHTFTQRWKGIVRPWHAGVLWDCDDRLPRRLLSELGRDPTLIVGDNEPYTGRLQGDTMWRHGTIRGLSHAIVEIRQDLVADATGEEEWAGRLGRILQGLLACPAAGPDLKQVRRSGS